MGSSTDPAAAYDEHVWDVYGYLAYRLGNREDAEDLTQQTFERALRSWSSFDPRKGSARTWLVTIAHNLLVDHYRRQGRAQHAALPPEEIDERELPPAVPLEPNLGVAPELAAAINSLSVRDREIVALRYGGDLTGPEIADLLGLSLANVQQILSRALRQMRAILEPAAVDESSAPSR